jgi:parallel beta-helix repeat protein
MQILVFILLLTAVLLQANPSVKSSSTNQDRAIFASTIISVPENYSSIQDAINAANPDDTVYVENGTYYESVYVNKTITLVGKNPDTTVIDGSRSNTTYDPVIVIGGEAASDFVLRNFTVRGSKNAWGVLISGASNVTVVNNIIVNNHGGMSADGSMDNAIINNTIANNIYEGLLLFESSGNTIKNNIINENLYNFGIQESAFDNDIDESNRINGKPVYYLVNQTSMTIDPITYPEIGYLALINCSDITVENLSLSNNQNGILVAENENITLKDNFFANNVAGIDIQNSAENILQDNKVANGWRGIVLTGSPYNILKRNSLTENMEQIRVAGSQLSHFLQDMDTTNTVDTRLVTYLINQTNLVVDPHIFPNIGYLALVNCINITVETLSMQNNTLLVAFSQNCTISQNNLTGGAEISLQNVSSVNVFGNNLVNGESAITASNSENSTITMNNITQDRDYGILLSSSNGNAIVGNNIVECRTGISLESSTNSSIVGNNVTSNENYGIILTDCHYNTIYHNNFVNNSRPGWQAVSSNFPLFGGNNTWDNGYPSGGNYWSDYNGTDNYSGIKQDANGPDAIGDASYFLPLGERDRYPLIGPHQDFTVWTTQTFHVETVSNSSISDLMLLTWLSSPTPYLQPGQQFLHFFVSGPTNTTGFCRITIPRELLNGTYVVMVDWNQVPVTVLPESNNTHAYLYFTFGQSEHQIAILPEYTSYFLTIMMLAITTIAVTAHFKEKSSNKRVTAA